MGLSLSMGYSRPREISLTSTTVFQTGRRCTSRLWCHQNGDFLSIGQMARINSKKHWQQGHCYTDRKQKRQGDALGTLSNGCQVRHGEKLWYDGGIGQDRARCEGSLYETNLRSLSRVLRGTQNGRRTKQQQYKCAGCELKLKIIDDGLIFAFAAWSQRNWEWFYKD